MGIKDWLQRKGEEKSASNIIDGLRRLVTAVRTDINETTNELAGRTAAMDAMVDGTQPWEADTFAQFEQDWKRWSSRKEKVVEAQKKLFDDLALWNSLPVERSVNEIVFPVLIFGEPRGVIGAILSRGRCGGLSRLRGRCTTEGRKPGSPYTTCDSSGGQRCR